MLKKLAHGFAQALIYSLYGLVLSITLYSLIPWQVKLGVTCFMTSLTGLYSLTLYSNRDNF